MQIILSSTKREEGCTAATAHPSRSRGGKVNSQPARQPILLLPAKLVHLSALPTQRIFRRRFLCGGCLAGLFLQLWSSGHFFAARMRKPCSLLFPETSLILPVGQSSEPESLRFRMAAGRARRLPLMKPGILFFCCSLASTP